MINRLRAVRKASGLTQHQLAERAGVSRQLVGAVETGRHLPRVDAALALAAALNTDAATLFGPSGPPVDVISGAVPPDGTRVRVGMVGDETVAVAAGFRADGWEAADGVIDRGVLDLFEVHGPGLVVAGCEPGLMVLESILREAGFGALAVGASSTAAAAALDAGRVHAAVVHGPVGGPVATPQSAVVPFALTAWRVGLAASAGSPDGWWRDALQGETPVIQREDGAGVQRAFETAAGGAPQSIPGPRVGSHLEAVRRAQATGLPAVTIEPAALAVGTAFHPLETHRAELLVAAQWVDDRAVVAALNVINSERFRRRLAGFGGYDLDDMGARVA